MRECCVRCGSSEYQPYPVVLNRSILGPWWDVVEYVCASCAVAEALERGRES